MILKMDNYDGVLICSGKSKEQVEEFKSIFANDNLKLADTDSISLQLRRITNEDSARILDVFVDKKKLGHFLILMVDVNLIEISQFVEINKMAEELFKEETVYGLKDSDGLDRVNKSLLTGWEDYEHYPTITEKAAALWYKISRNQFFLNGNKRTALLSAVGFLAQNMYTFNSSDVNKMYEISLLAAEDKISIRQISQFLQENVSLNYDLMSTLVMGE